MASLKKEQLRVRLPLELRQALEKHVETRGPNATVSSVLRDFLDTLLEPKTPRQTVTISRDAFTALKSMAKDCGRSVEFTLDQCVMEMKEMSENPNFKTPLLIREMQLRQQYRQE
jgi:hypothetical protein